MITSAGCSHNQQRHTQTRLQVNDEGGNTQDGLTDDGGLIPSRPQRLLNKTSY